ncbi:MAG: hypothetical protein WKF76_02735 [Nocardioidaceae bacterium]
MLVSVVLTLILRAMNASPGTDHTSPEDYYSDSAATRLPKAGEFVGDDSRPAPRPA